MVQKMTDLFEYSFAQFQNLSAVFRYRNKKPRRHDTSVSLSDSYQCLRRGKVLLPIRINRLQKNLHTILCQRIGNLLFNQIFLFKPGHHTLIRENEHALFLLTL